MLNWGMHDHTVHPPSPGYGPNMVHVCVVYDKIKMLSSCKKNRLGRTTCSVYEVDRMRLYAVIFFTFEISMILPEEYDFILFKE